MNCKYGQTENDIVRCPSKCGCSEENYSKSNNIVVLIIALIAVVTFATICNGVLFR